MNKTYLVSRHNAAQRWLALRGIQGERVEHFDPSMVKEGDHVVGNLPIGLVNEVCERGGVYFNLDIDTPIEARGWELSVADMDRYNARLTQYRVSRPAIETGPVR